MIHPVAPRARPGRPIGARGREPGLWLASGLLTVAALAPLFTVAIPPLADFTNHLARMHVIATDGADRALARFYAIHWQVLPNLVMDVIVPPLARWVGIYPAGRIFLGLNLLLMVGGVMALHRSWTGRSSPWPLAAFLFLYNHALLYGFMNFVFASALALWALAAWIALGGARPLVRGAVSACFIIALFFCHLFGIGLYGLGLAAVEGARLITGPRPRRDALADEAAALVLPFAPAALLLAISPTLDLARDASWDWAAKREGLGWLVSAYDPGFDTAYGLGIAALAVAGLLGRVIRPSPSAWVTLGLGVVLYALMPTILFGSWAADLRLPVALVFLLIGLSDLHVEAPWVRWVFLALCLILEPARFVGVAAAWTTIERTYDAMRVGLRDVAPGSRILVATADQPTGTEAVNLALSHAGCLAMIERSSFVSTAFTVAGKQILEVRPEYQSIADREDGDPPTIEALLADAGGAGDEDPPAYWRDWPNRYDYVLALYTAPGAPNPIPDHLTLVFEGGDFRLFKVRAGPGGETGADREDARGASQPADAAR